MATPLALVDCNNFYASCERLFQPQLRGRPVVVLSNNDGCVIARSNEAKALGIAMGAPWHLHKATFAARVAGDSMTGVGIFPGDIAVVDRSLTARDGCIILGILGGEFTLKRFRARGARVWLEAANPAYETRIFGPDRVRVQGKLVSLIRKY